MDFGRRKAFQRLHCLIEIDGQQSRSGFRVFAVEEVVAQLEEDTEQQAKIGDALDLRGRGPHRKGACHAASLHQHGGFSGDDVEIVEVPELVEGPALNCFIFFVPALRQAQGPCALH